MPVRALGRSALQTRLKAAEAHLAQNASARTDVEDDVPFSNGSSSSYNTGALFGECLLRTFTCTHDRRLLA